MRRLIRSAVIAIVITAGVGMSYAQSAADKGADLFKAKGCAMCHGADGKGQTPAGKAMKAGDFTSSEVQAISDADLTNIIENGKGKMAPQKSKVSAAEAAQIVGWIRTLKGK